MAKVAKGSHWECRECHAQSAAWTGKCPNPQCGSWNTMLEVKDAPPSAASASHGKVHVVPAASFDVKPAKRISVPFGDVDRVLGGGLVEGSTYVLTGDPGVGKSTALVQMGAAIYGESGIPTVYVAAEEHPERVLLQIQRLGENVADAIHLIDAHDADAATIAEAIREFGKRCIVVVDSVNRLRVSSLDSAKGSPSQIKAITDLFMGLGNDTHNPIILVAHVLKDGDISGPKDLSHDVDAVLWLEQDSLGGRMLTAEKNRHGKVMEFCLFTMEDTGLRPVLNPSEHFLAQRSTRPGAAATSAGTVARPLLAEVQALVAPTNGGNGGRTAVGFDRERLRMLAAALDRHTGQTLGLAMKDVYVAATAGLRIQDPGADLGITFAIMSSVLDVALPTNTLFTGEVTLTGEVRPAVTSRQAIEEAKHAGFDVVAGPPGLQREAERAGLHFLAVSDLQEVAARAEAIREARARIAKAGGEVPA